jgi:hypothetical protein
VTLSSTESLAVRMMIGVLLVLRMRRRDLEAVEHRQHEVEDDEIGVELAELGEAGDAVVGHDGVVALGLQFQVHELGDLLLVLDDEDQGSAFHGESLPYLSMRT